MKNKLEYLHLLPEGELPEIIETSPCKVVVLLEAKTSLEWQIALSEWLLKSGCLSMMAWGRCL